LSTNVERHSTASGLLAVLEAERHVAMADPEVVDPAQLEELDDQLDRARAVVAGLASMILVGWGRLVALGGADLVERPPVVPPGVTYTDLAGQRFDLDTGGN
jgi:hypothetical protein